MKKDVVLLTELLVADDKFNTEFFSAATEEQMYALARTKFPDFNRDDFSQFLQKLQKASDLCEQKLSPEELAEISGGAGGIGKKIASVMLTLTAGFGMAGATPVETNANITDILDVIGMDIGEPGDYAITTRSDQLDSVYCFLLGMDPEDGNGEGETIHNVEDLINELNLPPVIELTQEDILINIKRTNLKAELRALFARYNRETEYDSENSESGEFEAAPLELRLEVFRLLKESAPDLGDTSLSVFLAAFEEVDGNIIYKRDLLEKIASKLADAHIELFNKLMSSKLYKDAKSDLTIDCGATFGVFEIDTEVIEKAFWGNWHITGLLESTEGGYTCFAGELANRTVQAITNLSNEERDLLLAMDIDGHLPTLSFRIIDAVPVQAFNHGFLQSLANFSIDPTARRRAVSSLNVVEERVVEGNIQEALEFPEDWTWNDYKEAIKTCVLNGGPGPNDGDLGFQERIIGLDDAYGGVPLTVVFNSARHRIISFRPAIEEIPTEMIVRIPDEQPRQMQPMANARQMEEDVLQYEIGPEQQEGELQVMEEDILQDEIGPEQREEELQIIEEVTERLNEQRRRDRSNSRIRNRSNSRNREEHEERSEEEHPGERSRRFNRRNRIFWPTRVYNVGPRQNEQQNDDWSE